MSYEEKRNLLALFTLVVISLPYLVYIFARHTSETFATPNHELAFWATAVLIIIPIRILAEVIGHILMAIVSAAFTGKEDLDTRSDERDRLIKLRSTRNSHYVFMVAMLIAFLLAAFNPSISLMFSILIVGGTVAELVDIGSKIYMYSKAY